MNNKSRSLGRKTTEKQNQIGIAYGQNNIRDSSVSNTSNPSTNMNKVKFGSNSGQGVYNMMNNFMVNNLPQTFYNQMSINNVRSGAGGATQGNKDESNYSYEINLNAVNKSMSNSNQTNNFNSRSASNDYENNQKGNYYMKKDKQGIN
jgi:hypothetical protein